PVAVPLRARAKRRGRSGLQRRAQVVEVFGSSVYVLASAQALHVGGDVADLFRRQMLRDVEHDRAVGRCGRGIRAGVTGAVGVVLQLRHHIDRLLSLECRIPGSRITAAEWPVTGYTPRHLVTGNSVDVESLAGFTIERIGLEANES